MEARGRVRRIGLVDETGGEGTGRVDCPAIQAGSQRALRGSISNSMRAAMAVKLSEGGQLELPHRWKGTQALTKAV